MIRDRGAILLAALALLPTVAVADQPPPASPAPAAGPPAWAVEGRWYYIVVPRFRNGDPSNDPEGTIPWAVEWPTDDGGGTTDWPRQAKTFEERRYGGDLRGVIDRLAYLKALGVSAICLSPVFQGTVDGPTRHIDVRHVDSLVGMKGSFSETQDEGSDPATWKWSSSDRLLLELIKAAHEQGIRVVVGGMLGSIGGTAAPVKELGEYFLAAMGRWMDPNADGDPSDGVDGWIYALEEAAPALPQGDDRAFRRRIFSTAKKMNPNAVLIDTGPFAASNVAAGMYDFAVDASLSDTIQRFFHPGETSATSERFRGELKRVLSGGSQAPSTMLMLSALESPRLLTRFSSPLPKQGSREPTAPGGQPSEQACRRWRWGAVAGHFVGSVPMTFYGDEVGMFGGVGAYARGAMWWGDLAELHAPVRDDFRKLTEWLNSMREKYAPLRTGVFREVTHDDARKVFAFSRSLPGDEVIVVVNYGDTKQEVELTLGQPGQLVALLSPQMQPRTAPEGKRKRPPSDRLQVGGARQYVNPQGTISLWVSPESVRLVFVNDHQGS